VVSFGYFIPMHEYVERVIQEVHKQKTKETNDPPHRPDIYHGLLLWEIWL
jgi:hypothetical protein